MDDCVFCSIISGKSKAHKLYEDERYIAILDHRPRTRGHSLVIPKKHTRWVYEVEDFAGFFEVAKKVALACIQGLKADWLQFLTIGEAVPHAHLQVIPRYRGDRHGAVIDLGTVERLSSKEMAQITEKIRGKLEKSDG